MKNANSSYYSLFELYLYSSNRTRCINYTLMLTFRPAVVEHDESKGSGGEASPVSIQERKYVNDLSNEYNG